MKTQLEMGSGDVVSITHTDPDKHPTSVKIIVDGNLVVVTRNDTGDVVTLAKDSMVITKLESRIDNEGSDKEQHFD